MSDYSDPEYHRTFEALVPDSISADGRRIAIDEHRAIYAFQRAGTGLGKVLIVPRSDAYFEGYATQWERKYSKLCYASYRTAEPVVDERLRVIGHMGWWSDTQIWIPAELKGGNLFQQVFDAGSPAYINDVNPMGDPALLVTASQGSPAWKYNVMTAFDGEVVSVLGYDVGSGAESTMPPWEMVQIGKAVVSLVLAGTKLVGPMLIRKGFEIAAAGGGPTRGAIAAAARRALAALAGRAGERTMKRVTIEEMEALLTRTMAQRPELRRLMAARLMTGQGRLDAIRVAWREWERTQGWKVVEKTGAQMAAVTDARNFMTLRTQARELWVNAESATFHDADELFTETAHEFAAHALAGRGGSFSGADIPFVGHEYSPGNNALFLLENAITREGGLDRVLRDFR
jgi:hypothetical protein